MKKIRKPSYRSLEKRVKEQAEFVKEQQRRINELGTNLRAAIDHNRRIRQETFLDERIKLANSLGQMVEAVSRAIHVVIGKEQM